MQTQRHAQLGHQPLAPEALEMHVLHLDVVLGHQQCLHAVRVAQPEDLPAALAQLFSHGQPREDVAAGTAGHDQDALGAHAIFPRISLRFSTSMRSTMAMATQFIRMAVPPKLMKGSVSPLVGRSPRFTPRLMKTCRPIQSPMP